MAELDEKIEAAKRKLGQANKELQALREEKQKICQHNFKVDVRSPFEYATETWKVCTDCDKELFLGFN